MITGFAKQTVRLSDYERSLIEPIRLGLSLRDKTRRIKGAKICEEMKSKGYKINEERLRKIINYIRRHGLLFIVGTNAGYYSTNNKKEMLEEIKSMEQRASAIQAAADGLRRIFDNV